MITHIQLPIQISRESPLTLQEQIVTQLRDSIKTGCLRSSTQLSSVRDLAKLLNVSRNTVVLAYDQLIAEGYIETKRGRGTFVTSHIPETFILSDDVTPSRSTKGKRLPELRPPIFTGRRQVVAQERTHLPEIDFWVGRPDANAFPLKAWQRTINHRLNHAKPHLTSYGNPAGLLSLREAIADHLAQARGFRPKPNQIIVTHGIQEGLNLIARLFLAPGNDVVVESPCYTGAYYLFESYGSNLIPVSVNKDGLDVDSLPTKGACLAYVTPSHQYPTGYTLSNKRREKLLNWAWKKGCYIIEDDYDGDFRYSSTPLPALMSMDTKGCTLYAGTFSKSMGPGLRIGYLVLPEELVEPALIAKGQLDNGNSWLSQAAMSDFMAQGHYLRHLHKIRQRYLKRQTLLIEQLKKHFKDVEISGSEGGMHVAWHLPKDFRDATEIQTLAESVGVGIYAASNCAACTEKSNDKNESMLMLGYAAVPEDQIIEAINRLSRLPLRSDS